MAETLLRRIAKGDRKAVDECLDRYAGLVWALARRLCDDPTEAEDAVQEIFIELWSQAARFDPSKAAEATFVAMVARRRLIDRRRKRGRRPEAGPLPDNAPDLSSDHSAEVERRDEAERAMRAFEHLKDDQRLVLGLSIHSGLTHDEIAQRTGLPLGTVKTHARRGLIRLRELLEVNRNSASVTPQEEIR